MRIAAVIVNFRTADATAEAVISLDRELRESALRKRSSNYVIVVVDNDSNDGSLEGLRETFSDPQWADRVVVIPSGHNGGFGYGVNVGVRYVVSAFGAPGYVYVLNPDATVGAGAVEALVGFMDTHPEAGLLGNVIRNVSADVVRAFRFPSVLSELEGTACLGLLTRLLHKQMMVIDPGGTAEVDWVSGVSMLFRGEVFSTAGWFDEGFFLYFEEIDFARRVRDAGWKVYFNADVEVGHIGALATGMRDETRRMPHYWFESRRRYLVKHHGRLYAAACDAAWLAGHAIFKVKLALKARPERARPHVGRDFLRYSAANLLKPAPEAAQSRNSESVALGAAMATR